MNDINITLNINPEIIENIISRLSEFYVKEAVVFPEKISDTEYEYDWSQILATHQDDLTFQEVKNVIDDLEPDQKIDLLALLYIGKEDFDAEEWEMAQQEAKNNLSTDLTEYLFSEPQAAEYLKQGLSQMGYPIND